MSAIPSVHAPAASGELAALLRARNLPVSTFFADSERFWTNSAPFEPKTLSKTPVLAPKTTLGPLSALHPRALHEFFPTVTPSAGPWFPPLTLLLGLAALSRPGRPVAFVGKRCWPTPWLLRATLGPNSTCTSVFLDPPTPQLRLWTLQQALACPGLSAVIADGSGLNSCASRKLQLALESSPAPPLALLARPAADAETPSFAATRWRVGPAQPRLGPSLKAVCPRWILEAFYTRTPLPAESGRRWLVACEVTHGSSMLHLSAALGSPDHLSPARLA